MPRNVIPLALLAARVWSSTTEAQVRLVHKFPEGGTSTTVTDTNNSQTLTMAGMDIVTGSKTKLTVRTANGQRHKENSQPLVDSKIDA